MRGQVVVELRSNGGTFSDNHLLLNNIVPVVFQTTNLRVAGSTPAGRTNFTKQNSTLRQYPQNVGIFSKVESTQIYADYSNEHWSNSWSNPAHRLLPTPSEDSTKSLAQVGGDASGLGAGRGLDSKSGLARFESWPARHSHFIKQKLCFILCGGVDGHANSAKNRSTAVGRRTAGIKPGPHNLLSFNLWRRRGGFRPVIGHAAFARTSSPGMRWQLRGSRMGSPARHNPCFNLRPAGARRGSNQLRMPIQPADRKLDGCRRLPGHRVTCNESGELAAGHKYLRLGEAGSVHIGFNSQPGLTIQCFCGGVDGHANRNESDGLNRKKGWLVPEQRRSIAGIKPGPQSSFIQRHKEGPNRDVSAGESHTRGNGAEAKSPRRPMAGALSNPGSVDDGGRHLSLRAKRSVWTGLSGGMARGGRYISKRVEVPDDTLRGWKLQGAPKSGCATSPSELGPAGAGGRRTHTRRISIFSTSSQVEKMEIRSIEVTAGGEAGRHHPKHSARHSMAHVRASRIMSGDSIQSIQKGEGWRGLRAAG